MEDLERYSKKVDTDSVQPREIETSLIPASQVQARTENEPLPITIPTPSHTTTRPGFLTRSIAHFQSIRLVHALPSYYRTRICTLSSGTFGISLWSTYAKDNQIIVTSNQEICDLIRIARAARTTDL